jgi:hypothetical protein
MEENYIKIVQNLNEKLYEVLQKGFLPQEFDFSSNGTHHTISFGNNRLWFSAEDERQYFEETASYGDLETYVWKEFIEQNKSLVELLKKLES